MECFERCTQAAEVMAGMNRQGSYNMSYPQYSFQRPLLPTQDAHASTTHPPMPFSLGAPKAHPPMPFSQGGSDECSDPFRTYFNLK